MAVLLGLDPGFASIGYAIVNISDPYKEVVQKLGVAMTEKSSNKTRVLATEDNFRRAKVIASYIRPYALTVDAICVEAMSYPRNASTAAKLALFWGVLAAVVEDLSIPVVQVSPQNIKSFLCSKKTASKLEVKEAVLYRFAQCKRSKMALDDYLSRYPKTKQEHGFDALGAVLSSLDSDIILAVRSRK